MEITTEASTTLAPSQGSAVYPLGAVQFFLGAFIAAFNTLALAATASNRKLRTGHYLLLSNLWFANLILGVVILVANVSDPPNSSRATLQKAEGTVSVINSLGTLATFLAIFTTRLVGSRTPKLQVRTGIKVLVGIWSGIFLLVLVKTIVFTMHSLNPDSVCYPCLLGFEAALLVIFACITVLAYVLVMYTTCVHLKTAVTDSSADAGPPPDNAAEYKETVTLGILLGIFTLPFVCLIITLLLHTVYTSVDEVATEAILTLFYLHCFFNPLIYMLQNPDVTLLMIGLRSGRPKRRYFKARAAAKRIIRCRRPTEENHQDNGAAGEQAFRPAITPPQTAPASAPNQAGYPQQHPPPLTRNATVLSAVNEPEKPMATAVAPTDPSPPPPPPLPNVDETNPPHPSTPMDERIVQSPPIAPPTDFGSLPTEREEVVGEAAHLTSPRPTGTEMEAGVEKEEPMRNQGFL